MPLHLAAAVGRMETVNALLAAGANIHDRMNERGWTALEVAVRLGKWETVNALVAAGAE